MRYALTHGVRSGGNVSHTVVLKPLWQGEAQSGAAVVTYKINPNDASTEVGVGGGHASDTLLC